MSNRKLPRTTYKNARPWAQGPRPMTSSAAMGFGARGKCDRQAALRLEAAA